MGLTAVSVDVIKKEQNHLAMSRSAESAGRIMIIRIINLNDRSIIVNILETELRH